MPFLRNIYANWRKDVVAEFTDFSTVITDIHSHLLPNLDDGVKTFEEAIIIIKELADLGFKKLIITPHIMGDTYKNTTDSIKFQFEHLKDGIKREKIDIQIECAAEYYIDYEFEKELKKGGLLTFGNKYLLFELSYMNRPENFEEILFQILCSGYKPVMAHPERCSYWFNDFEKFKELKQRGAYFQININSLTGYYSNYSKIIAEKMIEKNMVDFIGSDVHNMHHLNELKSALKIPYLQKIIRYQNLLNKTV